MTKVGRKIGDDEILCLFCEDYVYIAKRCKKCYFEDMKSLKRGHALNYNEYENLKERRSDIQDKTGIKHMKLSTWEYKNEIVNYYCQRGLRVNEEKLSTEWDSVTCLNCINLKKAREDRVILN